MTEPLPPPPSTPPAAPPVARPAKKKSVAAVVRPWVRAVHRDAGYLVVGLTFVYALSGLAVNHLTDWKDGDPSFSHVEKTHAFGAETFAAARDDDQAVADLVRAKLGIAQAPKEIYREGDDELSVLFDRTTLHVNVATGEVREEGQKPRFVLRAANWLHLNRGKKAWTWVADGYAVLLLYLATSGLVMLPGKKGFFGRGVVLAALGAAVPIAYVAFAGP